MQVNIPVPWILWGIATRFFLTFLFYYDFFVAIGITLKTQFVFCANIGQVAVLGIFDSRSYPPPFTGCRGTKTLLLKLNEANLRWEHVLMQLEQKASYTLIGVILILALLYQQNTVFRFCSWHCCPIRHALCDKSLALRYGRAECVTWHVVSHIPRFLAKVAIVGKYQQHLMTLIEWTWKQKILVINIHLIHDIDRMDMKAAYFGVFLHWLLHCHRSFWGMFPIMQGNPATVTSLWLWSNIQTRQGNDHISPH